MAEEGYICAWLKRDTLCMAEEGYICAWLRRGAFVQYSVPNEETKK